MWVRQKRIFSDNWSKFNRPNVVLLLHQKRESTETKYILSNLLYISAVPLVYKRLAAINAMFNGQLSAIFAVHMY